METLSAISSLHTWHFDMTHSHHKSHRSDRVATFLEENLGECSGPGARTPWCELLSCPVLQESRSLHV